MAENSFQIARAQCGQSAPTLKHPSVEVQLKKRMDVIHSASLADIAQLRRRTKIKAVSRRAQTRLV
jgi:hypothetical protein